MNKKLFSRRAGATVLASMISVLLFVPVVVANAQSTCTSGLCDPLQFRNLAEFVQKVLEAFVVISLPILSFFIIWAGFMFVSARGNVGKLGEARENFKWLIIGAILILGAWALAQLIANTVNQIRA